MTRLYRSTIWERFAITSVSAMKERIARLCVKEFVSLHTRFRGAPAQKDGRITLLSVNYNSAPGIVRLLASFHKFVGSDAPAVIVENSQWDRSIASLPNVTYIKPFANLHHGLGLDYGMRKVTSEYTLICDPDSAIISPEFATKMTQLAANKGVAGIESAHWIYHPICLLFRTEFWKMGGFSFKEKWPWYDVAGELTVIARGREPETLLNRTKVAGPRFKYPIYLIEVYEDLFTNTYLGSRVNSDEVDEGLGLPRSVVKPLHTQWEHWVDSIVSGAAKATEFPFKEETVDMQIYDVAPSLMPLQQ